MKSDPLYKIYMVGIANELIWLVTWKWCRPAGARRFHL